MQWPSHDTPSSGLQVRPSSVCSSQSGSNASVKATSARGRYDICVGEELKIAVNIALERFRLSEEQKELEFPSSLTSTERAYIHRLCETFGFKSKSKGKGATRYLTVIKKDDGFTVQSAASFHLVRNSRHQILGLLQRFPLTAKERQELQQRTERNQYNESLMKEMGKTTTGRLNNGVPQIPPPKLPSELTSFQQTLPVYQLRDTLIKAITDNRVILIAGETGSGKTTQVPQMILEDSLATNRPCRIFCTQPRRLAALSVAERVAAERGEKIGQTVGYQIRLESRVSPKTLLTFCTNGVLLRTLIAGEQALSTVTHVIVDETHERDRFSDFLLIVLREILPKLKNLKVILMSAALNVQLFSAYFYGCPIVNVPGKLFEVQSFFLEDVLKWTGYKNKDMEKLKQEMSKVTKQQKNLDDLISKPLSSLAVNPSLSSVSSETKDSAGGRAGGKGKQSCQLSGSTSDPNLAEGAPEKEELEPWLIAEMDQLLTDSFLNGVEDNFSQIFHFILHENVSVDYVHSETSVSILMVAAARGFVAVVEQLLNLGVNVNARSSNDWTALDWAHKYEQNDIVELLEAHIAATELGSVDDEALLMKQSDILSQEDRELLSLYHRSFDDDKVDIDLILGLLHKIHSSAQEGAVLVFLPGYDEIVSLRDRIQEDKRFSDSNRYVVYILHSHVQSVDQKRVFKNPGSGVRKIILSTNVAETSVTIDDVVFVIDSGKVKEKSYDALTSVSMLKSHWISKASAMQRKGRAGRCRPGFCYHLFSRVRYSGMPDYQVPEILRYPLQELCLHTKLLAPVNCQIADFLAKAPEPPAFLITRNAVHILKQIDALDPFEDLTELGHHLADLPVEPRFGKMILYSVVLKCLDPILTIACALAYKDPFMLPSQAYQKRAATMARRKFSSNTFSDHMALLQAFQGWQKARTEGWERSFCERHMLSSSTMEMIVGMRTQLLGQLRASGFVRARGGGDIRDLNSNSESWAVVKAALCAGLYPNVVRVDRSRNQMTTVKGNKVSFHNSSVLGPAPTEVGTGALAKSISRLPTDWIVFEEMTRAHRTVQIKSCTVISPVTIAIFAGPAKLPQENIRDAECGMNNQGIDISSMTNSSDSEEEENDEGRSATLSLDDSISFRADPEAAALVMQIRQKWHSLFLRRMRAPTKHWTQFDESTIRTVVGVLTNEEQALGLQQPAGIGQRPRPMSAETVVSSGGSWEASTAEQSDGSSGGNNVVGGRGGGNHHGRSKEGQQGHREHKRDARRHGDDQRSETSSARSSNSGSNSLKGSGASSPCYSPPPSASPRTLPIGDGVWNNSSRYFVLKAVSAKMLQVCEQQGIWSASTSAIERQLDHAFREGRNVYIVFTVNGSSQFYGVARMTSAVGPAKQPGASGTFNVEWLKKSPLSFQQCLHLYDHGKIIAYKDGQARKRNAKTYRTSIGTTAIASAGVTVNDRGHPMVMSKDIAEMEFTVAEQMMRLWDKSQQQQHQQLLQQQIQEQQQQRSFNTGQQQRMSLGQGHAIVYPPGNADYYGLARGQTPKPSGQQQQYPGWMNQQQQQSAAYSQWSQAQQYRGPPQGTTSGPSTGYMRDDYNARNQMSLSSNQSQMYGHVFPNQSGVMGSVGAPVPAPSIGYSASVTAGTGRGVGGILWSAPQQQQQSPPRRNNGVSGAGMGKSSEKDFPGGKTGGSSLQESGR